MADAGGVKRKAGDAELDGKEGVRAEDVFASLDRTVQERLEALYASALVRREELDARALEGLAAFPAKHAVEILEQYERSGLKNVRNKSAYLGGVITRYRTKDYAHLHPDLQYWITQLYTSGKLKHGDLDTRCLEALEGVPLMNGVRFLERFFNKDFAEVRNPSALFMSTLRQAEASAPVTARYPPPAATATYRPRSSSYRSPGRYDDEPYDSQFGSQARSSQYGAPSQYASSQAVVSVKPGALPSGGANPVLEGRHNFGSEQHMLGVRTDEFHNLSIFSPYVHPATALKLQQLWDQGVRLVSLLDDRAWEALADLGAPETLAVIEQVAEALRSGKLRNPNAFFMSVSRQFLDATRRPDAAPAALPHGSMYRAVAGRVVPVGREWEDRREDWGGSRRTNQPGDLESLQPRVRERVQELLNVHKRYLRDVHFDDGVVDSMNRLSEKDAMAALDEVANTDMATVRNVPAYMMGIAKRYKRA